MKLVTRAYYAFLILFRFPTCLIHEMLHAIAAITIGKGIYSFSMNVSFKDLYLRPKVSYIFTARKWKEIIIVCAPIFGLIIPLLLSVFIGGPIINLATLYQLINFKYVLLSDDDHDVLVDMLDWKEYLKKLGFYDEF